MVDNVSSPIKQVPVSAANRVSAIAADPGYSKRSRVALPRYANGFGLSFHLPDSDLNFWIRERSLRLQAHLGRYPRHLHSQVLQPTIQSAETPIYLEQQLTHPPVVLLYSEKHLLQVTWLEFSTCEL